MTEPTPSRGSAAVLGRRGDSQWAHARACLASGRHAQALDALRRVRRLRPASDQPLLALSEADVLLGLHRPKEAVRVVTRALGTRSLDGDVTARLRVVRGRGLWLGGRVQRGRAEVAAAAATAREPLTHGRAEEALGRFAWKAHDHDAAQRHLETAQRIFAGCGFGVGMVQALGHHAGVLRDAGRLLDALGVHDRRLALAADLPRLDLRAQARTERAVLLSALGRWDEAGREIDLAAETFRDMDDDRELTVAGAARVVVDLARGELGRARSVLARLRDIHERRGQTRLLAEAYVLVSDVELAADVPAAADRAAADALILFQAVRDAEGECRSRVRRAHALLALDRTDEAAREAVRAFRCAAPQRGDLQGLALVAQGRALLRSNPREAGRVFAEALAAGAGRPPFEAAARLGAAVARAATGGEAEVPAAMKALEAFGDRRLLAYALKDEQQASGRHSGDARPALLAWPRAGESLPPVEELTPRPSPGAVSSALADAADALAVVPVAPGGWAEAMRALRPVTGWRRAALLTSTGAWELRRDGAEPTPLRADDPACGIARDESAPRLVDLREPRFHDDPQRVLHGFRWALVAPAGGATLYADLPDVAEDAAQDALGILTAVGRMLAPRLQGGFLPGRSEARTPAIVGRCPALQEVLTRLARVAPSEISVHISGETGTGKELFAEALHLGSPRRDRPFVAVNAASIPDELFESLMFGHAKGAFTGAVKDQGGYVDAADGGTLFLDEVADLSRRAQAKMLRFLEKREYMRVGEAHLRKADVRLVTAANRALDGELRPDLIFRIRELPLALPPLRERGQDLLLLARHFLERESRKARRPVPVLRDAAVRVLQAHVWPGNVRELQAAMRSALALCGGGPVGPEHLSLEQPVDAAEPRTTLQHAVRLFERDYITTTLAVHGGNRSRAARALGISRQTLLTKTRGLGV